MKEEDICGGSLNTIWAGGALGDTEVEVQCGRGSVQRVPEPDPLPGISFNTRPDSVLEIIG